MIKLNLVSKAFSLLINCFFIFTLIACSASQNSGLKDGPRVDPTSTTKVALLVPLGSGDTNQEDLANNLIRAAKMAITDHPKAKIKMKIYATSGNTLQAGRAARRAISDGVKIIIGPLFSESAVAVGKVAAANNVNVLSFSNTLEVAGGNIFILGNTFQNTADRIIGYASTKGYKSIAIVSPETSAGSIASSAVKSAAAKIGVQVIGSYSYPFSADGIANSASGIARKIRRSKSTAVVLTTDSASGLPLLAERLQARGLPIKNIKVLGLARWDIPQSTLNTPSLRNGWFTVPDGAAINDFNSRFNKIYGTPPHPLAGVAYDGMQAFAILLEQGNLGAAQRSQLTRPQGFQGSSGRFRLLEDGSTQRALSVAEASAGALRIISSAPTRFGGSGSFLYEITK